MVGLAAAIGIWAAIGDTGEPQLSVISRKLIAYRWSQELSADPMSLFRAEDEQWLLFPLMRARSLSAPETQLLIEAINATKFDQESRTTLEGCLFFWGNQRLKRSFFQAYADSGIDGKWQSGTEVMFTQTDPEAVDWWRNKMLNPATPAAVKSVGTVYFLELDPMKYADLILPNRLRRELVKGEGSALSDLDKDGDADNVDPWPNAAGVAKTDEQKIMAAAFETMARFDDEDETDVREIVVPARIQPFEMPGRRGQTWWRTSARKKKSMNYSNPLAWKGAIIDLTKGFAEFEFQSINLPDTTFSGKAWRVGDQWIATGRWGDGGMCGTWSTMQSWAGRILG